MTDKTSFPLEKILTISARDYVESKGNSLLNYNMVGVHFEEVIQKDRLKNFFAMQVPQGAEIVTDYKFSIAQSGDFTSGSIRYGIASGTALILKKKFEEK